MPRAGEPCRIPGCPNLKPCPEDGHERKPWTASRRREFVSLSGSKEQKRRAYVLDRDDTICHVCGYPGSDEVDHVVPGAEGGADSPENLAPIHSEPCHAEKTAAEAKRGAA